jgi:hypothetical protein
MVDRNTSTNYVGDWAKGRVSSSWYNVLGKMSCKKKKERSREALRT